MNLPTIADLKQFILAQPSDRKVWHSSWAACAVGDYAREVLGHEIYRPRSFDDYEPIWKDPVLRALSQESGTCDEFTAEQYGIGTMYTEETFMDFLALQSGKSTYGELVADLRQAGFI